MNLYDRGTHCRIWTKLGLAALNTAALITEQHVKIGNSKTDYKYRCIKLEFTQQETSIWNVGTTRECECFDSIAVCSNAALAVNVSARLQKFRQSETTLKQLELCLM